MMDLWDKVLCNSVALIVFSYFAYSAVVLARCVVAENYIYTCVLVHPCWTDKEESPMPTQASCRAIILGYDIERGNSK